VVVRPELFILGCHCDEFRPYRRIARQENYDEDEAIETQYSEAIRK
jgi:predicted amidohydrolase